MIAEATCISKPWKIIPLVVVDAGLASPPARTGPREQLIEVQNAVKPVRSCRHGAALQGRPRGSRRARAASHHVHDHGNDVIADPKTGTMKGIALHVVDATGLVHALLLRIQAILLPIKTLVLAGH